MAVTLNFSLASGAQGAVQQFMDQLQGSQREVFRLSDAIRNFDANGNVISQTFKAITASGKEMQATFAQTATGFELLAAKVDNAKASLKALEEQQKATQAAARRKDANQAETEMRGFIRPNYNTNQINAAEAAFQKVRAAIESGAVSLTRFNEILKSIRDNPKAILPNMTKEEAQVSRLLRNLQEGFDKTGEKAQRSAERLSISFAGIFRLFEAQVIKRATGALESAFIDGIQSSKDFSTQIALIRTISQSAGMSTDDWAQGIRRLSSEFGRSEIDVAKSAYEAISNQVTSGKDSFDFLANAMKFARTTGSSATDSVNLLSAALKNFNLDQSEANRVGSIFFKTIELGRVKASDLSDTFGRVGSIAAEAGVKLEEVGAALATITVKGVKPNDAMTLISNLLLKLIRPTEEMTKLFQEWGVASGTAAIQTFGFSGVLAKLDQEAQKGTGRMGELINQIRAMRGAFNLTGQAFDTYADSLAKITGAESEYAKADKEMEKSMGNRANVQLNKAKVFFSEQLGDPAVKAFVQATEAIGGLDRALQVLMTTAKYAAIAFGTYYYTIIRGMIAAKAFAALTTAWTAAKTAFVAVTGYQTAAMVANTAATNAQAFAQGRVGVAMAAATVTTQAQTAALAQQAFVTGTLNTLTAGALGQQVTLWAALMIRVKAFTAFLATMAGPLAVAFAAGTALGFALHEMFPGEASITRMKQLNAEIDKLTRAKFDNIKNLNLDQYVPSIRVDDVREKITTVFQTILQYSSQQLSIANKAKDATVEMVKEVADKVKISSKSLNDYVANGLKNLREQANNSKTIIDKLKKDSESIGRKFKDSIFDARMKYASEGRMDMASGMIIDDQKSQLIRNQIRQLREYISQEAKKGTKESYDEVKKTFDEISKLESQLFDADAGRRRREFDERVRRGTEQPVGFEVDPMTGQMKARYEFTVRTVDLEQKLKAIAQEKLAFNQKSIELEQKKIKELEKQEAIEKERARRLTQEFNALEKLSILNQAGEVKPEFKKDDGTVDTQKVLRQFDEITKRIKDAVGGQKALEQFAVYRDLLNFRIEIEKQVTAVATAEVLKRQQAELQIRQRSFENRATEAQSRIGLGKTQYQKGAEEAEASIRKLNDTFLSSFWDNSAAAKGLNKALLDAAKANDAFATNSSNRNWEILSAAIKEAEAAVAKFGARLTMQGKGDQMKMMLEELKKLKEARDLMSKGVDSRASGEKQLEQISRELNTVFTSTMNALPQAFLKIEQEAAKSAKVMGNEFILQMNLVIARIATAADELAKLKIPNIGAPNPAGPQPQPDNPNGLMFGGLPSYYNQGKYVSWVPRGSDTEPAMIGKREMVMTEQASMQFAPLLRAMNQGSLPVYMNKGGNVTNVGDINVTMQGEGTSTASAKEFAKTVRRGIRRGTISPFN